MKRIYEKGSLIFRKVKIQEEKCFIIVNCNVDIMEKNRINSSLIFKSLNELQTLG